MGALEFLTRRQKQVLDFISDYCEEHGVAPTLREIRDHLGLSSFGTVHKHLRLLQEKGYLAREWNQKRGLVVRRPGETEPGLPFFGRIAAGRPIEALPGRERLPVPDHLLQGPLDDHYVLEVAGTSMIGEGIFDGDLVVVRRRDTATAGEMVVALIDEEATLKRFFPEGRSVRLQPANPEMQPIVVPAQEVTIQGIVVGLMRRF